MEDSCTGTARPSRADLSRSLAAMSGEDWFRVSDFGHGVWRIRESGLGPAHAANIWLVAGRDRALLIDAGVGVAPLRPVVEALVDRPVICLLTHSHYDHIGGAWEFAERWAHPAEAAILADPTPDATMWQGWLTDAVFSTQPRPGFSMVDYAIRPAAPSRLVDEGDAIDLGGRVLTLIHVPGHSPGLLAVHDAEAGLLFTSDALYDGRMFFDLPGSDPRAGADSMARLARLPVRLVHPGHGESFGRDRLDEVAREQSRLLGA
ncbi:MBL fold metallo-hydrolase [Lichenifustis flavocetrariae]|uniref:MBL fold metallo-hydrolase n=1 Tax=Lichenifustis flavocetrariae TaxID=2949735 RepID=A0AA41YUY7_9HYPH|nr:MBL fold metallo-hydrolase [Lichenifustis flavocetrariae]MCW6507800.1 MBL fold metallo-hydrolase [Lichenifustis flavocetrariae]